MENLNRKAVDRVDPKPTSFSSDWFEYAVLSVCQKVFPADPNLRIAAMESRIHRIFPHQEYEFTLASSESETRLVLRLHHGLFSLWEGMEKIKTSKEFAVMRHVYQHGCPVPFPYTFDVSDRTFGHPFILLDAGDGTRWWEEPESLRSLQSQCVDSMAEEMAKLHTVVNPQHPLAPRVDVHSLLKELRYRTVDVHNDELQACFSGCEEQLRDLAGLTQVLLHGSLELDNVLVKDGTIRSVCNWENAAIGDPRWDVAYTSLSLQRLDDHTLSNRFVTRYVQLTGTPVDHLDFWEGLIALRAFALSLWLRSLDSRSFEVVAGLQTPLFDQEAEYREIALKQFG